METDKYYIMNNPSTSCGTFEKGDLVWVELGDKPCTFDGKMLTVVHWRDDLVEEKYYCEHSLYRFKSLDGTLWKGKITKTHIKITESLTPSHSNATIYCKDKKYNGIVSLLNLFEYCELETYD